MSKAVADVSKEIVVTERQQSFSRVFQGENFNKCLRSILPRHIPAERMIRVVLSTMQQNPKISECTAGSVVLAIMRAAAMGLEPDGSLGQGYLIPYGKECQFIPGYRGLIKLARNSGEVADVAAEVVYEGDKFAYSMGLNPSLDHDRTPGSEKGPLTHAYAIARFRDGEKKFVVLSRVEVDKIRDASPGKNAGPWKQWESEMWKKTAVRRLCKLLPLSIETQTIIQTDPQDLPIPAPAPTLASVMQELPAIEQTSEGEDKPQDGKLFDSTPSAQEAGV